MLKFIVKILLFFLFFPCTGKNQIVFNKTYNNYKNIYQTSNINVYNNEYAYCVLPVDDGYLLGGYTENYFWSTDSTLLVEAFYAKTDLNGDTIWQKTFNIDSNSVDLFSDVIINDSIIYFSGHTEIDTNVSETYSNLLLTLIDFNGNLISFKEFDFNDIEYIKRIKLINDEIFIFHNSPDYLLNTNTPCISKLDEFGGLIWTNCFYNNNVNIGMGDFIYIDGYFYLTGTTNDFNNPYYFVLYKIDTNGILIDSFNFSSNTSQFINGGGRGNSDYFYDENGLHIIMTGLIELSTTNNAAYLMSVDENGNKEWEKIIDPGPKNELFVSCQVLPDGRIVAISNRNDYENNFPNSNGSSTDVCWLTMLDKNGNTIWDRYISAYAQFPTYTYPYQVKKALDGSFAITGYVINNQIQSNGIFHRNDGWLCKTDSCGFTTGAQPEALLTVDSVVGATVYITNLSEDYCIASLDISTFDFSTFDSIDIYAYSEYTNGTDPTQIQYTFTDTGTYNLTLYTYAGDGIDTFTTEVEITSLTTSISSVNRQLAVLDINVFPNPSKDYFILEANFGMLNQVQHDVSSSSTRGGKLEGGLYTTTGQKVQSFHINPNVLQQRIYLNDLANGVYFVNFSYKDIILGTKRISVVK